MGFGSGEQTLDGVFLLFFLDRINVIQKPEALMTVEVVSKSPDFCASTVREFALVLHLSPVPAVIITQNIFYTKKASYRRNQVGSAMHGPRRSVETPRLA